MYKYILYCACIFITYIVQNEERQHLYNTSTKPLHIFNLYIQLQLDTESGVVNV